MPPFFCVDVGWRKPAPQIFNTRCRFLMSMLEIRYSLGMIHGRTLQVQSKVAFAAILIDPRGAVTDALIERSIPDGTAALLDALNHAE